MARKLLGANFAGVLQKGRLPEHSLPDMVARANPKTIT